jgi:DNA-binding GntR family transcriptional regulator
VRPSPRADGGIAPIADRPESLALSVYTALRRSIMNGVLPAGDRVTEAGLAKQLGVSKTPVREALLRLKSVGLVEDPAGRIVTPTAARVRNAFEVREALAGTASRLAAQRGERTVLRTVRDHAEAVQQAVEQDDPVGYRAADEAFQTAVAVAAGNRQLVGMTEDCAALVATLTGRWLPTGTGAGPLAVADALLAGAAERAADLVSEHVRRVAAAALSRFAS